MPKLKEDANQMETRSDNSDVDEAPNELDNKPTKKGKLSSRYFGSETEIKQDQDMEVIEVDDKNTIESFTSKPLRKDKKKKSKNIEIPIDVNALARHSRGPGSELKGVKTKFHQALLKRNEFNIDYAAEQAARAEVLLNEEDGYLIPGEGDATKDYSQSEIAKNVDITSATKRFELQLEFGPYRSRYTKNGRYLIVGGKKGHVAGFDWIQKRLLCEMNVMENVFDVTWLMNETMYAVAQKNWVHIYDKAGTELHCVKSMNRVTRLEYLPYHYLLNAVNDLGFLSWVDVSIGTKVAAYPTKVGRVTMMCQDPSNGVTCIGSTKGVVSMWAPSVRDPLVKMLCHSMPLTAITVDPKGIQMATAGLDNTVKIWDIRQLEGPLIVYHMKSPASNIDLSQKGLMAISKGNLCEVYRRPCQDSDDVAPYLVHRNKGTVSNIRFCPYEDVLGICTDKGFMSMLVPGSGEANFDSYEANPFQTKSQRREQEIHSLLEKIPMEFISLEANQIAEVNVPSLKEKIEAKKNLLYLKPPDIDFEPRKKTRKKNAKRFQTKQIMKETLKKDFVKTILNAKEQIKDSFQVEGEEGGIPMTTGPTSVLDRFNPKTKKK